MADYSNIIRREGHAQMYSPDELLDKFYEYVDYMHSGGGVIYKQELIRTKKGAELYSVPKVAPLTVKGFCLFARISHKTFQNYLNEASPTYLEYAGAAEHITEFCAVDMFNGASVGVFNGNLAMAMLRRSFGMDAAEDERDPSRVDAIRHELVFTDYTDVTNTAALPEGVPMDDGAPPIPTLADTGYDNKPNYHSSQDDMAAYMARNNIQQEDD